MKNHLHIQAQWGYLKHIQWTYVTDHMYAIPYEGEIDFDPDEIFHEIELLQPKSKPVKSYASFVGNIYNEIFSEENTPQNGRYVTVPIINKPLGIFHKIVSRSSI